MTIDQVINGNWQLSIYEPGSVVSKADDINQCIQIILLTIPGSDPFRPEFGSNVFSLIDQPIQKAIPEITKEILRALGRWEPRVEITAVNTYYFDGALISEISWAGTTSESGVFSLNFSAQAQLPVVPESISATVVNPQTLPTIRRLDWQLGLNFGQIVQGFEDINQCILTIIQTRRGSDPFRPDFGCGIWDWVSSGLDNGAIMAANVKQAVARWEPRVEVLKVSYYVTPQNGDGFYSGLIFSLSYRLKGGETTNPAEIIFGIAEDVFKSENSEIPTSVKIYVLGTENSEAISTEDDKFIAI